MTMTERQFTALARVTGVGEKTRTYKALKMVMCEGATQRHAAAEHEIGQQTVSNARARMVGAHAQLKGRIALLTDALGDGSPLELGAGGAPTHKGAV